MTEAQRDAVLLEHLPTVRHVSLQIHHRLPHHVELEDLVSAGVIGLMDAFSKFDRTRKVDFRSFAHFRIRGAILDYLRELDWAPTALRRKGRAIAEAARLVTHRTGHVPEETEIAAEMQLPLASYQTLVRELSSLEITTLHNHPSEESAEELLDQLPGKPDEDPLSICLKGEIRRRLAEDMKALPDNERNVLILYYFEERTMKSIARVLGVAESRISQIHASAVMRLRVALAALHPVTHKVDRSRYDARAHRHAGVRRSKIAA